VLVPLDAQIRAGRNVAAVHVWAKQDRTSQRLREFDLHVSPRPALALSAFKRGRKSGRYQQATVAVANTGNVPLRLRVVGADPKNLVKVDMPTGMVEIDPFETLNLDALLRGPIQSFGQKASHTIQFAAEGMGLDQTFDYAMEQRPAFGKSLKPYAALALIVVALVLLWPRSVVLEDYVGQDIESTLEALAAVGIEPAVVQANSTDPPGVVLQTTPAGGSEVRVGGIIPLFAEEVTVTESLGPETAQIPNVIGQTREAAAVDLGQLDALGVRIQYESEPSGTLAEGTVIRTEPVSGALAAGDLLVVYVSSGPAEITVPSFIGANIGDVRQIAEGLGLVVAPPEERAVTDPEQDGVVVDQRPVAGEPTTAGKSVTVWIGAYTPPEEETTTTTASG
jgi:beta-lactam-binding protein with PASTA domain